MKIKLTIILLFFLTNIFCQNNTDNNLFEANSLYNEEKYIESELNYRKSISKDDDKTLGMHNLGNNHYQMGDFDEASQRFFQSQKSSNSKKNKHSSLHNMGNSFMKKKDYAKALEAYKNALKNNSFDDETRYNYALAKKLLENENKSESKNEKEKNEKNKDEDLDKNKSEENKENKENGNESKDDNENKNESNQNNRDNKKDNNKVDNSGNLSPEQVKSILEAMNNQEMNVQDKINKKKIKGVPIKNEKDW
tara:strand:+ start:143718 stop:144470 length:753 start_codon:yes stop_codon:yes gene_type:complete